MAFVYSRFVSQTTAFNAGQITTSLNPSTTPVLENGPAWFTYASADDTAATISAANYFLPVIYDLAVNDRIDITGSDASGLFIVNAVDRDAGTISLISYSASATVGTADIQNLAVTAAKIANNTITATQIAASAITTATINNAAVTSAKLALTTIQYATVAITAAAFKAMYDTPILLVAAGGANTLVVIDQLQLLMTYVSANYAAGGVTAVQYDSTVHGAGVIASATQTAAAFQAAASTGFRFGGAAGIAETFTTCVNKGLYLSNLTGDFTTGDSTFIAHIWYKVIATV